MIRRALLVGAALAVAAPAMAAEGGPIRGGEHDGFSRIVLQIDPTTEWSLQSGPGKASIFFPGKRLDFGTAEIFDRMARNRVAAVRTSTGGAGTTVEVELGCDCRISTSFVGARYLALDVADPDTAAVVPATPDLTESAEARAAREAGEVASAEQLLIQQIEHAANQGVVVLSAPTTNPSPAGDPAAVPAPAPAAEAAPVPPAPTTPMKLEANGTEAADALTGLVDSKQIKATTVFDRDTANALAHMPPPPPPPECIDDDTLDVGRWSNGLPLLAQTSQLDRRIVGEFDVPDPAALADLVRLYIRFGFGAEAGYLLASFDASFPERALLLDLARAVEGRPVAADGPLAVAASCPGRHGLWLAIGGAVPVFRDAQTFATVQAAFADLPPDLRELVGPRLVVRLIDAGHAPEARLVYDTTARPGSTASADLQLAGARLIGAEGHPLEAAQALHVLIESNTPNSVEALTQFTRLVLAANLPLPPTLLTDLRAAVEQNRHSDFEASLRGLLAQTLARTGALGAAVAEVRQAEVDLPEAATQFDALKVPILADADPEQVGSAAYAEVILAAADLIGPGPDDDTARRTIAAHLLDLGLPQAALDMIAPAVPRGDPGTRLILARAKLRLGDAAAAQTALAGLPGPEAGDLRAQAFAAKGYFSQAAAALSTAGLAASNDPYAWPSGDWSRAAGDGDPQRRAMAAYMAARTGGGTPPAPAADPEKLDPEQAFQQPLPPLDKPSLDAARRLLATGPQVQGFVQGLLPPDSAAPPAKAN